MASSASCALYEAAKIGNGPKLAEILRASIDDIHWTDSKGWTPLHVAAYNANYDAVRLLLGVCGIDINKVGLESETALFLAVEKRNLEVAKILLTAGADAERPNRRSLTPLYVAVEQNDAEMVRSLLNSPCSISMNTADRRERTPLLIASKNGAADIVRLLLSRRGADVNRSDQDGVTPLNAACAKGALDVARILLQHNADVNRADVAGTTPLHHAASDNNIRMVELLLSFGAKPTTPRTSDGKSPLDLAKSPEVRALMQKPPTMQEIPPPPSLSPPPSSGSYIAGVTFRDSGSPKSNAANALHAMNLAMSLAAPSPLNQNNTNHVANNNNYNSLSNSYSNVNTNVSPQPNSPLTIALNTVQQAAPGSAIVNGARPLSPTSADRRKLTAPAGNQTIGKGSRNATPGREAIFAPIPPPSTTATPNNQNTTPPAGNSLRDSGSNLHPTATQLGNVQPPQKPRPQSGDSSNSPSPAAVSPIAASPPVQYIPSSLRPNSPPSKTAARATPPLPLSNITNNNSNTVIVGAAVVGTAPPSLQSPLLNEKIGTAPQPTPNPFKDMQQPPSPKSAAAAMLAKRQSGAASGGTHRPPIVPQVVSGELKFLEKIGEGAFGEVWKAKYRSTTVAVKRTHAVLNALDSEAQEEFRNEASIQSSIRHPYIVLLIGTSMDAEGKGLLITEYVEGGSLYHVLYVQRRLFERKVQRRLALHLATGLAFLHAHTPPIVHRDLKPENIFLGIDGCFAKIGDLGFAKMKTSQIALRTQAGTQLYMAPEMLRAETYTAAVDVYSFALVCFEIYTGVRPYPTSWSFPVMYKQVGQGTYRPPIPSSMVPETIAAVITRAWQADPNERPAMAEIVEAIEEHEF